MIQSCVVDPGHSSPKHAFVKNGVDIYTCPTCGCIMADLDFVQDQYEVELHPFWSWTQSITQFEAGPEPQELFLCWPRTLKPEPNRSTIWP